MKFPDNWIELAEKFSSLRKADSAYSITEESRYGKSWQEAFGAILITVERRGRPCSALAAERAGGFVAQI